MTHYLVIDYEKTDKRKMKDKSPRYKEGVIVWIYAANDYGKMIPIEVSVNIVLADKSKKVNTYLLRGEFMGNDFVHNYGGYHISSFREYVRHQSVIFKTRKAVMKYMVRYLIKIN